jgi:peptide/nickel transport system permease protein
VRRQGNWPNLRHALGLDLPLHTQYGHYLWQLGRGDLGQSFKFQSPVRRIIFERYPATLELAFLALVVCAAIAILAGMLAAQRRGQTSLILAPSLGLVKISKAVYVAR